MKRTIIALAVLLSACGGGDDEGAVEGALRGYAPPRPDWSAATGKGTYIFILDTGVRRSHRDFIGRLGETKVFLSSLTQEQATYGDCSPYGGHGTAVASVAARVASEATIVPVITVNCVGWTKVEDVVAAIDWVIAQPLRPAVINLSMGGGDEPRIDEAVRRAVAAKITVTVAAGNDSRDACLSTPARVTEAITAGAADQSGQIASFSNRGPCVDFYLPAVEQMVAWSAYDNGLTVGTGTSFAAPYAAGWAAKVLGYFPWSDTYDVMRWLRPIYDASGLPPSGSQ